MRYTHFNDYETTSKNPLQQHPEPSQLPEDILRGQHPVQANQRKRLKRGFEAIAKAEGINNDRDRSLAENGTEGKLHRVLFIGEREELRTVVVKPDCNKRIFAKELVKCKIKKESLMLLIEELSF